jgi:hypothetical protein
VAGEFSWSELAITVLRLLAAIWMFATSLGRADPMLGRIGLGQSGVRFVIGLGAMIPIPMIYIPALILTLVAGLFSRRLGAAKPA